MMEIQDYEKYLIQRGVRPTPNRLLILRALAGVSHPLSLADLETALDTVDRTSIFRVLELFAEKDIVHTIEDGSRSLKYELCTGTQGHSVDDTHVHFYCEQCRETFCLDNVPVPQVELPEGFTVHSVNYMIKGLCPRCGS